MAGAPDRPVNSSNGRRRVPGQPSPREPSFLAWTIATVSLILPWIGVPLCLWGALRIAHGAPFGVAMLLGGVALIVLDILIDFVWARSAVGVSDDPTLNQRGAALIGRVVPVIEPIRDGRGKVQVGDSVWLAEGPDAAAGSLVRITAARDVQLMVEPV